LRDAACDARREVSVPEFTRIKHKVGAPPADDLEEGIVDVLGWHAQFGEFLLDVTIRHPNAKAVADRAANENGHAAKVGETHKHDRYKPSGGRFIVPLAIETYGRIGDEFLDWLMTLSSAARARDRSAGLAGVRHLSKWRFSLSTTLYKGIAKIIEDSFALHDGLGDAPFPSSSLVT